MARVCVGCGLTTDANGNLIVDVSGTAGDEFPVTTDCTVAGGTHIYCDSATGVLYGEPEKFFRMRRFGKALTAANVNVDLTDLAPADNTKTNILTPISIVFENPSPCRPMNFLIESGISHVRLNVIEFGGEGDTEVEFGTELTVTGDASIPTGDTGHQIWAGNVFDSSQPNIPNLDLTFDSMGARSYSNAIVIPAGGSITIKLQGWMKLNSSAALSNCLNLTIDLVYTAWND